MTDAARYALYFTPAPETALATFGASFLGYDVATGEECSRRAIDGIAAADQAVFTAEPQRYGFHATLKAPFRLESGMQPGELREALTRFAEHRPAVPPMRLRVAPIGRFLALVPDGDTRALDLFAAEIVATFDGFRARLSPAERERRLANGLSPREIALLDAWGYPYVFAAFRFHLTLTGRLPDALCGPWCRALARSLPEDMTLSIDSISLLVDDDPTRRFRVIDRVPLRGSR